MCTGLWLGNLKQRGHLKNPSIDETIILKCTLEIYGQKAADWIHLVQDRDKW
jgi:hypothetical protein